MGFLEKYADRAHKIDLASTDYHKNPFVPEPSQRPRCSHTGCTKPRAIIRTRKDGSPSYRKYCQAHHSQAIAHRHGVESALHLTAQRQGKTLAEYQQEKLLKSAHKAGYKTIAGYLNAQARKAGFKNLTEQRNSTHPYKRFRKDYCENIDGRLGYKCTSTIVWDGMLDVDHKNGRPNDNRERNLQTLCKCCHAYKTNKSKDYATIGRKRLKQIK